MHRLTCIILLLAAGVICNVDEIVEEPDFETIEVMINETATLPCKINLRKEDKITLVIWYKNGSSVPIYSVDMRERHIPEHANHWSHDKIMGGRAHFNFDQRSLVIEHVTPSDEGFHKCRVDFKQTQTRNYHINLIVVVPVQNVTIVEAVPSTESGNSFVLPAITEGSSLTATCIAVGGNPKPKLTWWRGLDQLDYTYEESEDVVKNTLWIDNLQRRNMDDELSCKAENSNLTRPVYFNVSVNLHVGAEEIRFLDENKEMSAGHQYQIACQAKGSRPPANITWWKDSTLLKAPTRYSVSEDRKSAISVITFTPEATDSGKTLSCEATNIFVPHEKRKDFWTLKVNYAPIISLSFGKNINSSAIQENEDVYLECNIRADPWITKIRWLHNNKPITSNPSVGIIISNQTLVLQQVTKNSSGHYRCAGTNSEGESVSQAVKLDVKYEPICRANQQRVYGAERNEEINITCQVDGNPTPTWFRWSFNNSMVHIVSVNNFVNNNGSSVITYRLASETHYGTLLCSSQNELGPQVVPCVFHIVSAGKPDPPHNCSVVNKTESWLYVKCLRGFDGGLPQEFICEVTQEWNDKVISNITSKTEPEFRITGLEHRTEYRVVIYAANVKGKSKEYVLLNVSTAPEAKTQKRRSADHSYSFFKTHLVAKIAILSAIVLLILIVVIGLITRTMMRKHRRKRTDSEELRKVQLSQGSLSHSDDDKNPDLIPQSTSNEQVTGMSCPILNSISVQTASSESDISILPVREKAIMGSKIPTLLEANRLEELVWPSNKWSTTIEPIMLVLPESVSFVPKQNAETQTPSSPQNRKESAV